MRLILTLCILCSMLLTSRAQERPVGMNLSFHEYYSPQLIFSNVMRQSSYFKIRQVGFGDFELPNSFEQYPMRPDGYPTHVPFTYNGMQCKVHVIMLGGLLQAYQGGTYHLIFEGKGRVSVEWDAVSGSYTQANTLHPVQVTPVVGMYGTNGVHLTIEESDASDPIRNIRFLLPGTQNTYQTQKFNPRAVELLQGMKCIRGIHALNTNRADTNFITSGMQTPYDFYTQSVSWKTGINHRYLIELAQAVNADVWMNFPANVSDTLIRNVAQDFKNYLAPGQKVYIEYGNETWNFAPPFHYGANWVNNRGLELGLSTNAYQAGRFYTSRRSAELFKIFTEVFNGDNSRFVKVLASQGQNPWTGLQELYGMTQPNINPLGGQADALAIAPYFGGGVGDYLHNMGLVNSTPEDTIINYLSGEINTERRTELAGNQAWCDTFNVRLICYEAGQHLATSFQLDTALVNLLSAVNRNPKMKDLYCQYYDLWYEETDGDLMMAFNFVDNYSKYGNWGQLESMQQDTADSPKWKALNECVMSYNTTGINEVTASSQVKLYPNPAQDVVKFTSPVKGEISVSNAWGTLVRSIGNKTSSTSEFNVSGLPAGLYFVSGEFGVLKVMH
ncbi:MAG: T9SS type A sorting domain-containing protein [Bacteroidota bacterium]